jgi:dTDP-4-dehydrorhamnose 3,5-epimerase
VIEGVIFTPLRQIEDERGKVMHMLRSDAPHFIKFGEIYFSTVHPGVIKAWKLHRRMTLNYAVPVGQINVVLYDDRPDSGTRGNVQEIRLGGDNYGLLTVPPFIWSGFQGLGNETSMVANCATICHDPTEVETKEPRSNDIPHRWS